jgi:uncharacterized membrane protein YoaK (UPF0700 family)
MSTTRDSDEGGFGLALLLAALAGWVDAAGLRGAGGVFLSFMSGNTTDLAVSLTHQNWLQAGVIATVIVLFVLGVAAGEIVEPWGGRRGQSLVLGVEAILLAGGALLHAPGSHTPAAIGLLPLVFAMGLQNATMHRAGGISVGLTYVTGTLVQIGRNLAAMAHHQRDFRRLGQYLALWCSLAIGAGAGSLALAVSPVAALSCAAATAATLALVTALRTRPP